MDSNDVKHIALNVGLGFGMIAFGIWMIVTADRVVEEEAEE